QAVLVGVATGPGVFYRVPAARLALDAVVYLLMLAVYTVALYRVEPGSIDPWEVLLYIWVLSMCFSEVAKGVGGLVGDADTERRERGGAAEQLGHRHRVKRSRQRRGSVCCCSSPFFGGRFSTAVLMVAMLCRLGDYVQDNGGDRDDDGDAVDGEWRCFQAFVTLLASAAPLLLFRLLRGVAAFVPGLGPTVKAISLLAREASKVVPSLACLLLGTALALHVMYGEDSPLLEGTELSGGYVDGFRTFGVSCRTVARAGFGDIQVPDEDVPYGEPLYVLLYVFAAAGALGLVSMLIGVLSNLKEASPVEMEKQFQLARARLIVRAAEASRRNVLPAPFNLAQGGLALVISATQCHRHVSERRQ
ncbi:unnamed protein product, partial [Ectocarpus fasciculatus]